MLAYAKRKYFKTNKTNMQKSKLRFIVAALAALVAELFGPALYGNAHAVPSQVAQVNVVQPASATGVR
jgi:hypothetical protein